MGGCYTVQEKHFAVIESFGQFSRMVGPGIHCRSCTEDIVHTLDTRIMQASVNVNTKTLDNTFVSFEIVVMYQILEDKLYEAMYQLRNPIGAIQASVANALRTYAASNHLNDLFAQKYEMAKHVKDILSENMENKGYHLVDVLLLDIAPDSKVKRAMNNVRINEAKRFAELSRAETLKMTKIMKAEAEAECQRLRGVGFAMKRSAINDSFRESIEYFTERVQGSDEKMVLDMLMMDQHYDTLSRLGASKGVDLIVPYAPQAVRDLQNQISAGLRHAQGPPAVEMIQNCNTGEPALTDSTIMLEFMKRE